MPEVKLPPIEVRMETLLKLVAEEVRPCRACGVMLAMVRHHNGKLAPYDLQGINHFILCSSAAEFRRKKEESRG